MPVPKQSYQGPHWWSCREFATSMPEVIAWMPTRQRVKEWEWNQPDARWEDGFRRLLKYAKENRNTCPGAGYVDGDDYKLGNWCSNQRAAFRRGTLRPSRKARLDRLPFWDWTPPRGGASHRS
jgi:hypothetical protein